MGEKGKEDKETNTYTTDERIKQTQSTFRKQKRKEALRRFRQFRLKRKFLLYSKLDCILVVTAEESVSDCVCVCVFVAAEGVLLYSWRESVPC